MYMNTLRTCARSCCASASFCKRNDKKHFGVFFRLTVPTAVHLKNASTKFHTVVQGQYSGDVKTVLHFCTALPWPAYNYTVSQKKFQPLDSL